MRNNFFFILLIMVNIPSVFCQNQNNQWRFGNGGGINFNATPPVFQGGSPILASEGSASVADQVTGELLFYTDGLTVWDAQDQIMPNGLDLFGGSPELKSSTTAAVIVPKPGSENLYYILTIDEQYGNANGLRYSIVDMTLNNGFGDVLPTEKNVLIKLTESEKIEVIPAESCAGYWIITKDNPGNSFFAYLLSETGIDFNPVVSTLGGVHGNGAGHLKANHEGTKMACGNFFEGTIELYNFNKSTGVVSDFMQFNSGPLTFAYGVEFSPNDNLLYVSDLSKIIQFDLSVNNPLAIENSAFTVVSSFIAQYAALQLGPNGIIYANAGSIDGILNPNGIGTACNFQSNVIENQTGGGGYGLPKFVPKNIAPRENYEILSADYCVNSPTQFSIVNTTGIESVNWNFGDGFSTVMVSPDYSAEHTYTMPGNFLASAIMYQECSVDTLSLTIPIVSCESEVDELSIFAPNVITPNQDGVNDVLILPENAINLNLKIVNRWGVVVFESTNYSNDWNGTDQIGIQLSDGVYTYLYMAENGLSGHGFIHLLR
jgi:gliding motility-associated-like protein